MDADDDNVTEAALASHITDQLAISESMELLETSGQTSTHSARSGSSQLLSQSSPGTPTSPRSINATETSSSISSQIVRAQALRPSTAPASVQTILSIPVTLTAEDNMQALSSGSVSLHAWNISKLPLWKTAGSAENRLVEVTEGSRPGTEAKTLKNPRRDFGMQVSRARQTPRKPKAYGTGRARSRLPKKDWNSSTLLSFEKLSNLHDAYVDTDDFTRSSQNVHRSLDQASKKVRFEKTQYKLRFGKISMRIMAEIFSLTRLMLNIREAWAVYIWITSSCI